jgi:hypothetical protein
MFCEFTVVIVLISRLVNIYLWFIGIGLVSLNLVCE